MSGAGGDRSPAVGYPVRTRTPYLIRRGISGVETAVYLIVGVLLILAALLTVGGTLVEAVEAIFGAGAFEPIPTGILVLDRVLLVFIVAELLYTLRLVLYRGEILAEPFRSSAHRGRPSGSRRDRGVRARGHGRRGPA